MIISIYTMYIRPFPGILGGGVPVNLNLSFRRITKLKENTKLDDLAICILLHEFFSRLDTFCTERDRDTLTLKSELLKYIHGESEVLNDDLLSYINCLYNIPPYSDMDESSKILSIPKEFWGGDYNIY